MWKYILRGLILVVRNPAVQQWARRKARKLADKWKASHAAQIEGVYASVGLEPPVAVANAKASRLIRTKADVLKPGNTTVIDGEVYKVTRLISASASEVVYEATLVT